MPGVKADIKRCLDMREAYALLDYEDASIATCRLVLVHAMMSPQFLRAAPGRRFIAFACTLQPQLVRGTQLESSILPLIEVCEHSFDFRRNLLNVEMSATKAPAAAALSGGTDWIARMLYSGGSTVTHVKFRQLLDIAAWRSLRRWHRSGKLVCDHCIGYDTGAGVQGDDATCCRQRFRG